MLNRRRGTALLSRFRRTTRTGPRALLYIFELVGRELVKLREVGPTNDSKLMLMTHAELLNGPVTRPSSLISVVPYLFHLVELNPCPVVHYLGRHTHRHKRSTPP